VAVLEELALAILLGLASRHLGIRLGDLGFGDLEILAVLLRVEPGEEVTLFYLSSDIDRPLEDLAVHSKPDIRLVTRLDLAGQRSRLTRFFRFDSHGADWPNIGCGCLLFLLAGCQSQDQNEDTDHYRRRPLARQ